MSKLSSGVGGDHPTYSTWVNSSKFSIDIPELTSMCLAESVDTSNSFSPRINE
jgi:hypothetical protein